MDFDYNVAAIAALFFIKANQDIVKGSNSSIFFFACLCNPGPGCSKIMTSLVNVSLKFQMLISEIRQYFLLKKCEKLQKLLSYFHPKILVYLVIMA